VRFLGTAGAAGAAALAFGATGIAPARFGGLAGRQTEAGHSEKKDENSVHGQGWNELFEWSDTVYPSPNAIERQITAKKRRAIAGTARLESAGAGGLLVAAMAHVDGLGRRLAGGVFVGAGGERERGHHKGEGNDGLHVDFGS
jgi:hypothetical protein